MTSRAVTSRTKISRIAAVWLATTLAGCLGVSGKPVTTVDYLDPKTVNTVTHLSAPVVFAREEPSLAANVRDYLYAGPVEVNQMGEIRYYLWIGEWSTIDRLPEENDPTAATDESAGAIVVWLDGQPNTLSDDRQPTLGQMPYRGPVDSLRSKFFRVSRDQLRQMAEAQNVAVQLQDAAGSRRYQLWSGDPATFAMISDLRAMLE